MKTLRPLQLATATLAALTLSLSSLALARPAADMPWGQAMCEHAPMHKSGRDDRPGGGDFQAAAKQRLERLQGELKLTPAQQPAWQNFVGKMQQQAADMQTRLATARPTNDQASSPAMHAPERMARGIDFMKQRLASMENMQLALQELYAVLTPEQKQLADRHFQRTRHERRAGRHDGHMRHERGQHRH